MIDLLNKLLARFGFQLVSTKPDMSLVKETLRFMNTIPKSSLKSDELLPLYVGNINYLEDKNGRTYHQDLRSKNYFCDYDVKNTSKEVLGLMITETKFTPEELAEKLND